MRYSELTEHSDEILTQDIALKAIMTKCSDAYNAYISAGKPLFLRGVSQATDEPHYFEKSGEKRPPAYYWGPDYYEHIFDGLPEWQGDIRRDLGLIGTTSARKAMNYAGSKEQIFVVFPENGAKIHVAPADDWWNVKVADVPMKSYIDVVFTVFKKNSLSSLADLAASNRSAYKTIRKDLNPKNLGIKTIPSSKIGTLSQYSNNEIWTSASCYALPIELWQQINNKKFRKRF